MKHSFLVKKSVVWLRRHSGNIVTNNCSLVITELVCATRSGEIPDVIGFSSGGSVLIEVKTRRADFLVDRKKPFRICPESGVGELRFYCCPQGMIDKYELPFDWGLLYADEKGKISMELPANRQVSSLQNERVILLSVLRRNKIRQ